MGRSQRTGPGWRGQIVALAAAGLLVLAGGTGAEAVSPGVSPGAQRSTGWHPRVVMLADLRPGGPSSSKNAWWFTPSHGRLFFPADDGVHGIEPWISDGTRRGTTMIGDLVRGRRGSRPELVVPTRRATVFITARDAQSRPRWTLWSTTTGAHGARTVRELPVPTRPFYWVDGARVGRYAVISADAPVPDTLLRTDGTVAGTTTFRRWTGGQDYWWPDELRPVGRFAYFYRGPSLWRTDATTAGTRMLHTWAPRGDLAYLSTVGRRVDFGVYTDGLGGTVWTSDGTRAGTHLVKKTYAGLDTDYRLAPTEFTRHGRWSVFIGGDRIHGRQIWRTDGTARGTTRLTAIHATAIHDLTSCGGALYFIARDDAHGRELWVRSGHPARVRRIDIVPGPAGSHPGIPTCVRGHLVFSALDKATDRDPWTLAGPRAHPVQHDLRRRGNSVSWNTAFTRVGTDVFFTARDDVHGREPWVLHAR